MLRVLQVANVGRIVGGTAACAWTVARALPWAEHHVAFLGPIAGDTRAAFRHARLLRWERVTAAAAAAIDPDVVLLHNTPRSRCDERIPAVTIQYLHSHIAPASADLTLYCSQWLAGQYADRAGRVLHQAVPVPPRPPPPGGSESGLRPALAGSRPARTLRPLVIGRLCTPQARKWPAELADFYRDLAARFPETDWEFVGCPPSLEPLFRRACGHRARFHEPGWHARSLLWRWDALLYHHPTLAESFGRTCAEAMRAGCIPVVDDRGGFREQIPRDPSAGFLCSGPAAFAAAVEQLHDPAARERLSRAARHHADQRFSLARFATDLLTRLREAT